jgi:hypothetical protein
MIEKYGHNVRVKQVTIQIATLEGARIIGTDYTGKESNSSGYFSFQI